VGDQQRTDTLVAVKFGFGQIGRAVEICKWVIGQSSECGGFIAFADNDRCVEIDIVSRPNIEIIS
jgi:hypothetical protein